MIFNDRGLHFLMGKNLARISWDLFPRIETSVSNFGSMVISVLGAYLTEVAVSLHYALLNGCIIRHCPFEFVFSSCKVRATCYQLRQRISESQAV